jgi:hypothetical protein
MKNKNIMMLVVLGGGGCCRDERNEIEIITPIPPIEGSKKSRERG